jgi:hypothetical protein
MLLVDYVYEIHRLVEVGSLTRALLENESLKARHMYYVFYTQRGRAAGMKLTDKATALTARSIRLE